MLRRLLVAVPVLLVSTFVVFVLVSSAGDPLADFRARTLERNSPEVAARAIAEEERFLRLDRPVVVRYTDWVAGVVTRGDFGPSREHPDIGATLSRRLAVTLRLVIAGMLLAGLLAVGAAVVGALRQERVTDHALTLVAFVFLAMPVFWFAVLVKQVLAIDLNQLLGRRVLSTSGERSPDVTGGWLTQLGDILGHLVLPSLVLALTVYAAWSRFLRASMVEALASPYVRLARAKGLPRRSVVVRHALRTALVPFTTVVAIDFAAVLGGAVITETVFAWQGMGRLLLEGVAQRDAYVVTSWLVVAAVLVVLLNLVADLLYAVLDPRVRLGGGAGRMRAASRRWARSG